jgi:transcriptional regulator with XRE-family HTH domain
MNIQERRRINLDRLIGSPGKHGRIAQFARTYRLDPSYISQLLNQDRTVGEKSARDIESALGIPEFSLDAHPDFEVKDLQGLYEVISKTPKAKEFFDAYLDAPSHLREAALHVLQIPRASDTETPNEKPK